MLVVEDHALVRSALRRMLLTLYPRFGVREAGDGASALALCREHEFSVVFLDITLPDASGLELIAPIIRLQPRSSVIVVSHHEAARYAAPSLAAGAFAYVAKDAICRELTQAIDRALQQGAGR